MSAPRLCAYDHHQVGFMECPRCYATIPSPVLREDGWPRPVECRDAPDDNPKTEDKKLMVSVNIPLLIRRNQSRWDAMRIEPGRAQELDGIAHRLCASKDRFVAVEQRLIKLGFYAPWWFAAVCSEREYGGPPHWDRQLAQGDPLSRRSWHEPAGRGPFRGNDAWERGCLDALIDCAPHAAKWHDWSPGGAATIWEEYNGLGYAAMGVPSAYAWSGSNQYVSGKYIADHVYRAGVKDVQEGCMPILSRMIAIDSTIHFGMPSDRPTGLPATAASSPPAWLTADSISAPAWPAPAGSTGWATST